MPNFIGPDYRSPFGKNVFLHSTHPDPVTDSYTMSYLDMPTVTIDGEVTKVLQPGTAIAAITSGPQAGMYGVFQAGGTDGREDTANIVGLNLTFLPWQLNERDVEIAVTQDCYATLAWCFEYDAAGLAIPLAAATADAMRNTRYLDIKFA